MPKITSSKTARIVGLAVLLGGLAATAVGGVPADAATLRHVLRSTGI